MSDTQIQVNVDYETAVASLGKRSTDLYSKVRDAVIRQQNELFKLIRQKLSGDVLNVVSGKLRRSIQPSSILESFGVIAAYVYSDSTVKYARIHEYGGVIHHPGSDQFQAWEGKDGWHYSHYTRPHEINMPERSFMRSSLMERESEIRSALSAAVKT